MVLSYLWDHNLDNFETTLLVKTCIFNWFLRRKSFSVYSHVKVQTPLLPHLTPQDHYWKEDCYRLFSVYSYVKFKFPLWSHHTTGNHDLKKPKTTPPEDDSTQVTVCLTNWFKRRRFLKIFLYKCLWKMLTPYWAPTFPQGSCFKQTWI